MASPKKARPHTPVGLSQDTNPVVKESNFWKERVRKEVAYLDTEKTSELPWLEAAEKRQEAFKRYNNPDLGLVIPQHGTHMHNSNSPTAAEYSDHYKRFVSHDKTVERAGSSALSAARGGLLASRGRPGALAVAGGSSSPERLPGLRSNSSVYLGQQGQQGAGQAEQGGRTAHAHRAPSPQRLELMKRMVDVERQLEVERAQTDMLRKALTAASHPAATCQGSTVWGAASARAQNMQGVLSPARRR